MNLNHAQNKNTRQGNRTGSDLYSYGTVLTGKCFDFNLCFLMNLKDAAQKHKTDAAQKHNTNDKETFPVFDTAPKLQIIFHKRATKYRSLLPKMTCKKLFLSWTLLTTYCRVLKTRVLATRQYAANDSV